VGAGGEGGREGVREKPRTRILCWGRRGAEGGSKWRGGEGGGQRAPGGQGEGGGGRREEGEPREVVVRYVKNNFLCN
jgi:hypothetical protein